MNLLSASISAGILILVILLIRWTALKHIPKRTFVILWGVVLLRLLIPVSIPSPVNLYAGFQQREVVTEHVVSPEYWEESTSDVPDSSAVPTNPAEPMQPAPSPKTGKAEISEAGLPVRPTYGKHNQVEKPLVSPFWVLWGIGVLVCAIYFTISFWKTRKALSMALPLPGEPAIQRWMARQKIWGKIYVMVSDRITTPIAYGVIRRRIILPKNMDRTKEEVLGYVLTHELVHIKRFDLVWKWLSILAVCMYWFHPLVWVMYLLLNRDIELSCDEKVVSLYGMDQRSTYAMSLLYLTEQRLQFMPVVGFGKSAMKERIVVIMKMKKNTVLRTVVSCFLIAGMLASFAATTGCDTTSLSRFSGVKGWEEKNGYDYYQGQPVKMRLDSSPGHSNLMDISQKVNGGVSLYVIRDDKDKILEVRDVSNLVDSEEFQAYYEKASLQQKIVDKRIQEYPEATAIPDQQDWYLGLFQKIFDGEVKLSTSQDGTNMGNVMNLDGTPYVPEGKVAIVKPEDQLDFTSYEWHMILQMIDVGMLQWDGPDFPSYKELPANIEQKSTSYHYKSLGKDDPLAAYDGQLVTYLQYLRTDGMGLNYTQSQQTDNGAKADYSSQVHEGLGLYIIEDAYGNLHTTDVTDVVQSQGFARWQAQNDVYYTLLRLMLTKGLQEYMTLNLSQPTDHTESVIQPDDLEERILRGEATVADSGVVSMKNGARVYRKYLPAASPAFAPYFTESNDGIGWNTLQTMVKNGDVQWEPSVSISPPLVDAVGSSSKNLYTPEQWDFIVEHMRKGEIRWIDEQNNFEETQRMCKQAEVFAEAYLKGDEAGMKANLIEGVSAVAYLSEKEGEILESDLWESFLINDGYAVAKFKLSYSQDIRDIKYLNLLLKQVDGLWKVESYEVSKSAY
ncbi:MAG: M56 family metallopeptidase [Clostridiales bacterium]|nr:M56 family metallopeptidase [Clostridiales bacterium]